MLFKLTHNITMPLQIQQIAHNLILECLNHYYTPPNTFIVSDKFLAVHDQ